MFLHSFTHLMNATKIWPWGFFRVPKTTSWRLKNLPIRNLSTITNMHILIWLASRIPKRTPKDLEWVFFCQCGFQRKWETPCFRSLCVENEAFLGTSSNTKRIYLELRTYHKPCNDITHIMGIKFETYPLWYRIFCNIEWLYVWTQRILSYISAK